MDIQFEKVDLGTGQHALIGIIEGAVDTQTVRDLEKIIMGKFKEGNPYFLLDFAKVKYINSTGMGTMVKLGDVVRADGGELCLININPKVKELFNMLGLLAVIKTYDSKEDGLNYLAGLSVETEGSSEEKDIASPRGITSAEPAEPPDMVLEDKKTSSEPLMKDSFGSVPSSPPEVGASVSKGGIPPLPEEKVSRDLDGLNLEIEVKNLSDGGGLLIINIEGAVDTRTIGSFEKEIMAWEAKGAKRFILDCANVKYINSTGMGTMVKLGDVIREKGGEVLVAKLSPKIRELFDMLGLLAVIKTVETVEEGEEKLLKLTRGKAPSAAEEPTPPVEKEEADKEVEEPASSESFEDIHAFSAPEAKPPVVEQEKPAPPVEKEGSSASSPKIELPPPPTEEPKQVKKAGGAVGVAFTPTTRDLLQGYKALFITIEGALDAATVKAFEEVIMGYASQGYIFQVLDFGNVKYINSTGMGTLVKLGDVIRDKGGDLHLVHVDQKMKELFNMLGLLPVIEIVEKEEESYQRFQDMLSQALGVSSETSQEAAPPPPEAKPEAKEEPPQPSSVSTLPPPPALSNPPAQDEMSLEKKRMELIQQGNQLEREGKYEEAIAKWEEALELTEFKEGLIKKIDKAKAQLSQKKETLPSTEEPSLSEDEGLIQRVSPLSEEQPKDLSAFNESPTLIGDTSPSAPDFHGAPTIIGGTGSPLPPPPPPQAGYPLPPPPPPKQGPSAHDAPTMVGGQGSMSPPFGGRPVPKPPSSASLPQPPAGARKISSSDVSSPLASESEAYDGDVYDEEEYQDPRVTLLLNILFIFTFLYFLGAFAFGVYFYINYMQ